jgi:hypothetical protein
VFSACTTAVHGDLCPVNIVMCLAAPMRDNRKASSTGEVRRIAFIDGYNRMQLIASTSSVQVS